MGSPFDILGENPLDAARYLKGINPDTSKRFTADELLQLDTNMGHDFPDGVKCIIGSCLGGALEDDDVQGSGPISWLVSAVGLQNDALSAQSYCRTDLTFGQALDQVQEKSPVLAEFIRAKRATVKQLTVAHYDKQIAQDKTKVLQTYQDTAEKAGDALTGALNLTPVAVAVGIVVALAIAAVIVARKAS